MLCPIVPLLSLIYYKLFESLSALETLTESYYKKWACDIKLALGLMNLDIYLLEDKPSVLSDDISSGYKTKERSNCLSMRVPRRSISETNCGRIPSCETIKEFLNTIGQKIKYSINQNYVSI